MAGRTPFEAVQSYVDPLRLALSCVTRDVLAISPNGYKPRAEPHFVTLGTPTRLSGERTLHLEVAQKYRIVEAEDERGPWKVSTAAYEICRPE